MRLPADREYRDGPARRVQTGKLGSGVRRFCDEAGFFVASFAAVAVQVGDGDLRPAARRWKARRRSAAIGPEKAARSPRVAADRLQHRQRAGVLSLWRII